MLDKFGPKGLTVLVVNVSDRQDDMVMPFLKEQRYTFVPLKSTAEVAAAYGVSGVPSEFVIDRDGQVLGRIRLNNDERERQFEKLMEGLIPAR